MNIIDLLLQTIAVLGLTVIGIILLIIILGLIKAPFEAKKKEKIRSELINKIISEIEDNKNNRKEEK